MEFVNTFTVPVGVDRAFDILTDLERVAPCLPGAVLEEVDGATYTGKVKVKVGPMAMTYRGTAEITEKDVGAKHAVIHAKGREARGAGTATANVAADLVARGEDATEVTVTTDLTITGKPAQFGRGVMAEVGTKLIDTFAERLSAMVAEDEDGAAAAGGADATGGAGDGGGTAGADARRDPADDALPPATQAPTADTPPAETIPAAQAAAASAASSVADAAEATPTAAATPTPAASSSASAEPVTTGPRRIAPPAREPEALDLMEVAGGSIVKRLLPLVVVAGLLALLWWRRRAR